MHLQEILHMEESTRLWERSHSHSTQHFTIQKECRQFLCNLLNSSCRSQILYHRRCIHTQVWILYKKIVYVILIPGQVMSFTCFPLPLATPKTSVCAKLKDKKWYQSPQDTLTMPYSHTILPKFNSKCRRNSVTSQLTTMWRAQEERLQLQSLCQPELIHSST